MISLGPHCHPELVEGPPQPSSWRDCVIPDPVAIDANEFDAEAMRGVGFLILAYLDWTRYLQWWWLVLIGIAYIAMSLPAEQRL